MNPYQPRIDPPHLDGPPEYHRPKKQVWVPHPAPLCDYESADYLAYHGQEPEDT